MSDSNRDTTGDKAVRQNMARPQVYTDDEMIAALNEKHGQVSGAADLMGCEADTIYNRMKVSPGVKRAATIAKERTIDHVENALFSRIDKGDIAAIIFYLKTQGKERGYMERNELTLKLDNFDPALLKVLAKHGLTIEGALIKVMEALQALPDPDDSTQPIEQPTDADPSQPPLLSAGTGTSD